MPTVLKWATSSCAQPNRMGAQPHQPGDIPLSGINEDYALSTWVESYNRHFSDRAFELTDGGGNVVGRAHSTWVAIDMRRRTMADLSDFERDAIPCLDKPCGISPARRIPTLADSASQEPLHFSYSDIDFNRHVNTVRYLARCSTTGP